MMNITQHPELPTVGETYERFLNGLVEDALATAKEMEMDPQDALQNIIECLHEDAAEKLTHTLQSGENYSI